MDEKIPAGTRVEIEGYPDWQDPVVAPDDAGPHHYWVTAAVFQGGSARTYAKVLAGRVTRRLARTVFDEREVTLIRILIDDAVEKESGACTDAEAKAPIVERLKAKADFGGLNAGEFAEFLKKLGLG